MNARSGALEKNAGISAGEAERTEGSDMPNHTSTVRVFVGGETLAIELADNSSAEAFANLLAEGPLTIEMTDYGGFEKVGSLGASLPANDASITAEPGDVILYQGDKITIYYGTNSWSFTHLGRVRGVDQDELERILGEGKITAVFSL